MYTRIATLLACCFIIAVDSRAQCLSGDCKAGTGKMDMGYAVYEGSFKAGQPDGTGTMDYGGGDKYTGGWSRGKEHGSGTLYKKGVASTVYYRDGVLQVAPRKEVAIGGNGDWKEKVPGCITGDCYDGYGEISFPSGNRYAGGFKNGVKSGQGKMVYASGSILTAEFVANNPTTGSYYDPAVNTTFTGTFYPDGAQRTGMYTSPGIDGVAELRDGVVIAERHPRRDSINAIAAKHAQEYGRCGYCEGKGEYLNTTWSSIKSTRTEGSTWSPTGGNQTRVEYKTTGGFAQNMVTCPKCKGTGEVKRR